MAARQRRSRRNSRSFPVISPISGLTCVHTCVRARAYTCIRYVRGETFTRARAPSYSTLTYRAVSLARGRNLSGDCGPHGETSSWRETSLTLLRQLFRRLDIDTCISSAPNVFRPKLKRFEFKATDRSACCVLGNGRPARTSQRADIIYAETPEQRQSCRQPRGRA